MSISSPYYVGPRQSDAHLNLDGEWEFGCMPEQVEPERVNFSMKATVPGTVFRQLNEAGRMPESIKT